MSSVSTYNNDKVVTVEVEYPANDPASGAFFQSDFKKNGDLKLMLDGSKDSLKLEAMKRIIGMIAKGRDASDLFPAVVKNVVSKNIEVKKLVYVYLVRYAEEQQDLALLSISTFQRALKDPNQLIRASALRVLSSIRVTMIVPIVMLAIRDSASDMSPYVRKTAAHAIPKLYSLDPDQKEELVAIIDKLLSDKAPLVVGSAAMAFSEVCPDRVSLIHRSYRKLCSLLADVDEWGQLALLNVLTVYAKTCFPDPNNESYSSDSDADKPFYESGGEGPARGAGSPSLDADHRLLLRAARPLLQSRNTSVVMAVAQLFYHCGPVQELPPVAKALVRLLRAPAEVQSVVLNTIASLTVNKPSLFEPFLRSFFVRTSDPTHIKLLKLEILTNLATEANAGVVLRECHTYAAGGERTLAAATAHALGRLARLPAASDACLAALLRLLSARDERVVCEAVVVVKRVVGGGAGAARAAVSRAARLLRTDRLAANARAAAIWLVAEHGASHPRAAAVLAHMATTFADQEELVKLQVLSLAAKLSVRQPATLAVCRYVITLARYDASYDVRDRARLLRRLLLPDGDGRARPGLAAAAAAVCCPDKPHSAIRSSFTERAQFSVGTLSQYLGSAAAGYRPLPAAPLAALGAGARDPPPPPAADVTAARSAAADNAARRKNKDFYSEPESSGSQSSSTTSSDSSSSEDSSDDEESVNDEKKQKKSKQTNNNYKSSNSGTSDSESDSDSSSGSEDSGSENSSESSAETTRDDKKGYDKKAKEQTEKSSAEKKSAKSNLELLLELDDAGGPPPMMPSAGVTSSVAHAGYGDDDDISPSSPVVVSSEGQQLVPRVVWSGLAASMRWLRTPHLYSPRMCAIEITFTNHSSDDVSNIRISKKTLTGARAVHDFAPIASLPAKASATCTLGVDFADTIQPLELTLACSLGEVGVSITPTWGELVRAVTMTPQRWDREHSKLRGMTECIKKNVPVSEDETEMCKGIFVAANLAVLPNDDHILRFSGRLVSSGELVVAGVRRRDVREAELAVACGNVAAAQLLAAELRLALTKL